MVGVVAGAFFFFAGTVGLLRFPDSLTRLHALTKADNLGLGLVVLGLLPQVDSVAAGLKLVCIWLLVLLSGATAAQLIARTLRQQRPGPMIDVLNIGLAALILGLAVWTIVAREASAAVVGFIAYGLLLTLVWVQLQGIDVALTEAAIGGGLTGALLIGAAVRLRSTEVDGPSATPRRRDTLACGGLVRRRHGGARDLCARAARACAHAGAGSSRQHRRHRGRQPDHRRAARVSRDGHAARGDRAAVRADRGLVAGARPRLGRAPGPAAAGRPATACWPMWRACCRRSASSPASTSSGSAPTIRAASSRAPRMLAAMWLLVMMAGLADAPPISRRWLRWLLVAGPLAFIAVGVLGAVTAGAFLAYPHGFAKPLILVIEFALMPTLTLVLGLMLLGAPLRGETP